MDVDHLQELTVFSLCAGYGGIELGVSRALANPLRVVAVEIEAFALANLEAKAAHGALAIDALWPDVRTFPAARFRGCFDILTAGYPCQPFSLSGHRKGSADPRHLWPSIAGTVRRCRPEFVFLENVAGHLSLGIDRVIMELVEMGYCVAPDLCGAFEAGTGIQYGYRVFLLGQAAGRRRRRACLSIRPRGQDQADADAGGAGAVLGPPDGVRRQGVRLPETQGRGLACRAGATLGPPDSRRLQGKRRQSNALPYRRGHRVAPQGVYQHSWEPQRFVEPGLGRTPYGHSSRLDRLRLCGNGVSPAQADLAFRRAYDAIWQATSL